RRRGATPTDLARPGRDRSPPRSPEPSASFAWTATWRRPTRCARGPASPVRSSVPTRRERPRSGWTRARSSLRSRPHSGRRRSACAKKSSWPSSRRAHRGAASRRSAPSRPHVPVAPLRDPSSATRANKFARPALLGSLNSRAMRQASLATKIGTTAELRPGTPDVIVASEPTLCATLRTKGRFYFLCEVARQQGNAGGDVAKEVSDLARQEYYYDLSAGIEVSLRKALRQANRRAAQRLR